MQPDDARLSRIETLWSMVKQASRGNQTEAQTAQQRLLDRYGGAVRRYLFASLRNEEAADEVYQEFALRFVRGDFKNADETKGRFRGFVKTVIFRLMVDYHRRSQRDRHNPLTDDHDPQAPPPNPRDADFTASWRSELLGQAWKSLQDRENSTGKPYYTVLRFRADHPEMRSPDMASELSLRLGREINAGNARVLLHRSRDMFAEVLLEAVQQSLVEDSNEELEEELISLDLLNYCKPALERRR